MTAHSPVTDRAIDAIKRMITSRALGPGDRLPPEKELAETIGVSRNSLREAVKALSVIRVLDVRQGDGTYVTSLEPQLLVQSLSFMLDLHEADRATQVLDVRRVLEPVAVRRATGRLREDDFAHLDDIMRAIEPGSSVHELVEADMAFHAFINDRCGNPYLSSLLEGLATATARTRMWRGIAEDDSIERTLREHRQILAALREELPDVAEALAAAHVASIELWLHQMHEQGEEAPHLPAADESAAAPDGSEDGMHHFG